MVARRFVLLLMPAVALLLALAAVALLLAQAEKDL